MNVGFWALGAAQKGRKKPVVPGSSGFILEETAFNLRATKDAKTSITSSLQTSVSCINEIIACINSGSTYEELITKLDSSQPPPQLSIEESYRTSSTWAKSDGETLDFSSRPDLLLQNSERIVSSSVPPPSGDLSNDGPESIPREKYTKPTRTSPIVKSSMATLDIISPPRELAELVEPQELEKPKHPTNFGEPQLPVKPTEAPATTHLKEPARERSRETSIATNSEVPEPAQPPNLPTIRPENDIKVKMEFMSHDHSFQKAPRSASLTSPPDVRKPDPSRIPLENRYSTNQPLENVSTARKIDHMPTEDVNSIKKQTVSSSWTQNAAPSWMPNTVPDLTQSTHTKHTLVSDPSSLSPIKLVNGRVAPTTSPNVDLSFIPIAKSVGHGNLSEHPVDKLQENYESMDSDNDNSFQAISTAIRKSFAGKTSMGHYSGPSSSNKDLHNGHDASKTEYQDFRPAPVVTQSAKNPSKTKDISIKMEHGSDPVTSPSNLKSSNSRSRSFYNPRHTASIFVTLPNKESIALQEISTERSGEVEMKYPNSRPPGEESRSIPTRTKNLSQQEETEKSPPKVQHEKRNLNPIATEEKLRSPQIPKLFSGSTFSEAFPAARKLNKSPSRISKVLPKRADKSSGRPSDRYTSRTTIAGSPVRRAPISKPQPISRSPSKLRTSGSSTQLPASSSVNSSRSPTKYSHRATYGNFRRSPKSVPLHPEPRTADREPQLQKPVSSSLAAGKTVNEKDFLKNRFLTTSLLPDNSKRPKKSFHPDATVVGSTKLAGSVPSKLTKIENASKDFNTSLKSETKPRPKITLNFHSKQDLKPANDPRGISTRTAISPEKKDRSKMEKLQATVTKGMNTLPNPTHPQSVPRKRAFGNAVPLPDAARGKLRKENVTRAQPGDIKGVKTPSKAYSANSNPLRNARPVSRSSSGHLPDIPSDDDLLRSTKYLKSWAETPEILRVMEENQMTDPTSAFGECADLDLSDIFRSVKSSSNRTP